MISSASALGRLARLARGGAVCTSRALDWRPTAAGIASLLEPRLHGNAALLSSSPSQVHATAFSTVSAADSTDSKERLLAACILERLPVVLPEPPSWESDFQSFCFERQQQDRKEPPKEFIDASSSFGREDEELEFEPAPCVTEADLKNDRRSLNRALAKRLYLIVCGKSPSQPNAEKPVWHFPQVEHSAEETMRQAAERALAVRVGSGLEVYFVGNAPCGHIVKSEASKVFFFRSQFLKGALDIEGNEIQDYAWVTKSELAEYLADEDRQEEHMLMQKMLWP